MALSDCIKCWSTPCVCGHEYEHWTEEQKNQLIQAVSGFDVKSFIQWIQGQLESGEVTTYTFITSTPESLIRKYMEKR